MNPLSLTAGSDAEVWEVFDRLVDDAARLAKSGASQEAFDHELLRRSVDALSALGGIVWIARDGSFAARSSYFAADVAREVAAAARASELRHREVIEFVAGRDEPTDCAARSVVDPVARIANPYDAALLAVPIVVDRRAVGVLELLLPSGVGADARQGALRIVALLADSIADFERDLQRRLWRERATDVEQFDAFVAALYDRLDSTAVAYTAAQEGRRWSEFDRVAVLRIDGDTAKTLAVSGVDVVDRRSDQVRYLERLVAATVREGAALWHVEGALPPDSPHLAQALSEYMDHADATSLVVLPLDEQPVDDGPTSTAADRAGDLRRPFAAVVFERFAAHAPVDDVGRDRLQTIARHVRTALLRSLECESIPLGGWWRRRYRTRSRRLRRLQRAAWITACIAAVVGAFFVVPARSTVEARGRLEPEHRRELFAPAAGVVVDVAARHGKSVAAGDVLVVFRRPELTVELQRVAGELQVAESRLAALRAARTFETPRDLATQIRAQERTAEEEQLKESIRSLSDQRRLLLEQVDDLSVKAPFAGTVTTWEVEKVLGGRPVERGQALLGIADVGGAWELDVFVPEKQIADLLSAKHEQTEPLAVEFTLATNPGRTYHGRVVRVAETTETDADLGIVVKTTVAVDRNEIPAAELRPGAAATVRIDCGPSSLGAVWTRDLRRAVRSWWW